MGCTEPLLSIPWYPWPVLQAPVPPCDRGEDSPVPAVDVCVHLTSPLVLQCSWGHGETPPAPSRGCFNAHPSDGKPAQGQPSAPRGRAEDWEWPELLQGCFLQGDIPWLHPAGSHQGGVLCSLCFPGAPSTALGAAREFWGWQGKGRGPEPPWWLGSPGRCPLLVPPQCWWLLLARVSPRWALQGPGLAGLSRHLLAAERMLWTKPLKLFFCISRILILWGSPQSVRGEQPVLPSCCSPSPTPLLLFGCLVPALPESHCTDTSCSHPCPGPAGAASASLQPCFPGLPLLAASSVPSLCSAGCAR